MPRYPVVLFDLDGTLLDTTPMIIESLRHTVTTHLPGAPHDDATLLAGIGTPLERQFETLQRRANLDPTAARGAALLATYLEHNLGIHDAQVRAFEGVPALLDRLAARGARLGIVTSKHTPTARRGLEVTGLLDRFECLIGKGEVRQHKPHPEPVLTALQALQAPPQDALFVGDSPYDLHAGRAAGVTTAAAAWGPFPAAELRAATPDLWLGHPDDLG